MSESATHLRIIEETPAYWRVVFDNPPLNIMGAAMFEGLQDLLARIDASPNLRGCRCHPPTGSSTGSIPLRPR